MIFWLINTKFDFSFLLDQRIVYFLFEADILGLSSEMIDWSKFTQIEVFEKKKSCRYDNEIF